MEPLPIEITITDAPTGSRYIAGTGGVEVGFVEYRRVGSRIVFLHTEVAPAFEGRGIASALARHVLRDATGRGLRIHLSCPYLRAYAARHEEWRHLLGDEGAMPGPAFQPSPTDDRPRGA